MSIEQRQVEGNVQEDALLVALRDVIPDFSYPKGFYTELEAFLFDTPYSFFDKNSQPILLKRVLRQLTEEDADNLLTVLEGAKALIEAHNIKNIKAYNQFMAENKANRFFTS